MLSGTARYSASAVQCLNNNFLSLSDDPAVEALLQDIPFFAVGLLGFGVATIMFVCRRMARPGIFIVVSIVLAFVAATLDLFRILFEMRTSEDNTRVTALFIAREVCIALGQSSRFLFFWDYARRSPIIDSFKTRPGIARMALEGGIIVGAVAVAVVQTVWRLAPTGVQQGPVYLADMILELVLGAVLSLKIVRFFFVRGTPASYIRRGVPIVGGIAIQMGINIASLFVFDFEDSMLGRFLQAIELYIIVLVVLIASMDDPSAEQLPVGASSGRPVTSRSSFMAMAIRNSLSPFRPAPGPGSSSNGTGPRRPSMTARMPTVDRVSQWITRRMSARTVDRVENAQASVRLWTKPDEKDLESAAQIVTMDEKAGGGLGVETAGMDASPGLGGFREQQVVATWRDPVYTAVGNGVLTPMTADTNIFSPPARPDSNAIPLSPTQVAQLKAARRASLATSVVLSPSPDTVTRRSSSNSRSSRSIRPRSMQDSPVFGLEGIIRNLGLQPQSPPLAATKDRKPSSPRTPPSAGVQTLLERQAELDDSLARLNSYFPAEQRRSLLMRPPSIVRPGGGSNGKTDSGDSSIQLSIEPSSFKSEFSLSALASFPDPPDANRMVVDDISFDLVPPPGIGARALNGAPMSVASTSASSLVADYYTRPMEGRPSVEAFALGRSTQLDVTSFIGDLSTPRPPDSQPTTPMSAIMLDIGRNIAQAQRSPLARDSDNTPTASPIRTINTPAAMLRGPAPLRVGTAAASVAPVPPETPTISIPQPAAMLPITSRGEVARSPDVTSPLVISRRAESPVVMRGAPRTESPATFASRRAESPVVTRMASRDTIRAMSPTMTVGRSDSGPAPVPARLADDLRSAPSLRRPGGANAVRALPISGPITRQTRETNNEYERPRAAPAPGN